MISFYGIGNLTKDPESVDINGTTKINFSIACNDPYAKDKEKGVSYFDAEMWGKSAEAFAQYHGKGDKVYITGRLVQERWKTKEGENRYAVKLKGDNVEFVKTRENGNAKSKAEPISEDDVPF